MVKIKTERTFWTKNFIIIMMANLFVFFSFQMIFPTLPLYIKKLGGSDAVIGLVIGSFTISSLLTRPFAGLLLDRKGRKRIFLLGLIILILTALSYSFATSIEEIFIIRLLHGFGWGIAGTATATLASGIIPKERFGEGMGYFTLTNSFALAIAPAAGIYIALHYSFQALFLSSTALVTIAFFLALTIQGKCFDNDVVKCTKENPHLYEKSAFGASLLYFFVSVTYGAIASFLPIYAMQRGIENIGDFFTVYAISILVTRPFIGKIIDRYGFDFTLIPGLILLFFGVILLSYSNTMSMFLIVAIIYGVGFGSTQTSLQTMAVRGVQKNRLGAANATFFTGLDSGIGLGAIVLGATAELVGYSKMYLYASSGIFIAFIFYIIFVRKNNLKPVISVTN